MICDPPSAAQASATVILPGNFSSGKIELDIKALVQEWVADPEVPVQAFHPLTRGHVPAIELGFERLDAGVPLLAFLFLVALGVDYNIFLVARAAEETSRPVSGSVMLVRNPPSRLVATFSQPLGGSPRPARRGRPGSPRGARRPGRRPRWRR